MNVSSVMVEIKRKVPQISQIYPDLSFCVEKYLCKSVKSVGQRKKSHKSFDLQLFVPRPGIEPGWIAPLVFETSASTDSAIWANASRLICGCKGTNNF